MKNGDVIAAFVHGERGESGTLRSTGEKLFSYNTVIAERVVRDGERLILLNRTKYSVTTTRHQNEALRALAGRPEPLLTLAPFPVGAKQLNFVGGKFTETV